MANNFYYGGQAVIEGVMMRGRSSMAIAVRKASGEIVAKEDTLSSITQRYPFLKRPLLRGVVALIEAMVIGMRALNYSASQFAEEEEAELGAKEIAITMGFALLLTIGLFVVLPAYVVKLVQGAIASDVLLNVVEGLVKITFFILYIVGISFMKDIRRVFQYHGAEHMAINCYEAGDPLTVEDVRRHTLIHKRCGTSFIIFVLLVSIFIFSFFGRPPFLMRVALHLALLPVVAGISYEIIRLAGRPKAPWIIRVLSLPGMWTQRLTTRVPDDSQIEVAIHSLKLVLERDNAADGKAGDGEAGVRAKELAVP